jgi:hypothetical protein
MGKPKAAPSRSRYSFLASLLDSGIFAIDNPHPIPILLDGDAGRFGDQFIDVAVGGSGEQSFLVGRLDDFSASSK